MNPDSNKLLFVLQFVGQPRFAKRMSMVAEQGFTVEAVAFERPTHRGRSPAAPVTTLGNISHGNFIKRIPTLLKSIPILRKKIRANDAVYCMGPDMSLLVSLASIGLKTRKLVEVADIHPIQTRSGVIGKIARLADKWQIKNSDFLVVTAPNFMDTYYQKWLKSNIPGMVIENKVEQATAQNIQRDLNQVVPNPNLINGNPAPITIGYFGLLRCKWSWETLVHLVKNNPTSNKLVLAGVPLNIADFEQVIDNNANIEYYGPYKSPEDLPNLYQSVDLVWACYPPIASDNWNHKWARPNRFYEACLYKKPLISRNGSNDSVVVSQNNIGFVLDEVIPSEAAHALGNITSQDISEWQSQMKKLPESVYQYTTEAKRLGVVINQLISKD